MSQESPEMEKLGVKGAGKGRSGPTEPKVHITYETLSFNKAARERFGLDEYGYIDFYLSTDSAILGAKPIHGVDADGNSYSVTGGGTGPKNVIAELPIDVDSSRPKKFPCEWDDEQGMVMIHIGGRMKGSPTRITIGSETKREMDLELRCQDKTYDEFLRELMGSEKRTERGNQ